MENENRAKSSLGLLCMLLTFAFIIFKVLGLVAFTWFWVFFPVMIYFALQILIFLLVLFLVIITD
jgi:hypothetical protein